MMRRFSVLLFTILSVCFVSAQESPGLPPAAVMIDLTYGMQLPEGNLKKDFYQNFNLSAKISYLSPKNWLFSVNGDYIFADDLKTDVLAPLRMSNGLLIERTGRMGLTQLGQRGFYVGGQVGRLFQIGKKTRMHNIEVRFGGGYLQHWIRIRLLGYPDDLPQLKGEYLNGYDRRTSGIALQQYVGYRFMSRSKLINLFIGLDFTEGFTFNRRYWNFDTRTADKDLHTDILLGFKAGFCIPFFIYTDKTSSEDLKFY